MQLLHRARYRRFVQDIGLFTRTTPVESPQKNGHCWGVRPHAQAWLHPRSSCVPASPASSSSCPPGSITAIAGIRIAHSSTGRFASLSNVRSERTCPAFRGEQQWAVTNDLMRWKAPRINVAVQWSRLGEAAYSITLRRLSIEAAAKAVKLSATAYGRNIVRSWTIAPQL